MSVLASSVPSPEDEPTAPAPNTPAARMVPVAPGRWRIMVPSGWLAAGDHIGPMTPTVRAALAGARVALLVDEVPEWPPHQPFCLKWEDAGHVYSGIALVIEVSLDDDPAATTWTVDSREWSTPAGQTKLLQWVAERVSGKTSRGRTPAPGPRRRRRQFVIELRPYVEALRASGHAPGLRRVAQLRYGHHAEHNAVRLLRLGYKRAGYNSWRDVRDDLEAKPI